MKSLALAAVLGLASVSAFAAPISPTQLSNNVLTAGTVNDSVFDDDDNARYFSFYSAGGAVTIDGSRIDGGFDMGFWLFSGAINDTSHFGGGVNPNGFDNGDAGFITFSDDPHAPAVPGPFGDPFFAGNLAAGWYTIAVVDVLGNGNTGGNQVYDYTLLATGITAVPEPATLGLLGLGLVGVAASRRRK